MVAHCSGVTGPKSFSQTGSSQRLVFPEEKKPVDSITITRTASKAGIQCRRRRKRDFAMRASVPRHRWIHNRRPCVYASAQRLHVVKALIAQPDGNIHRAHSVMADCDDMRIGIKLMMGTAGDFAHGHQDA